MDPTDPRVYAMQTCINRTVRASLGRRDKRYTHTYLARWSARVLTRFIARMSRAGDAMPPFSTYWMQSAMPDGVGALPAAGVRMAAI
jgi:hypothetical protein